MASSTAAVSPRAAERIRAGHPWVPPQEVTRRPDPGEGTADVVTVVDRRGVELGTALFSAQGPIALRMLARSRVQLDARLLEERIARATERRRQLLPGCDAWRAVHAEADLLPGLFIDRYADVAVVQTACAAMDARKDLIAEVAMRVLGVRLVACRDDGSARDFEALPRDRRVLAGSGPTTVAFHDAGSALEVDVLVDGKTGAFLDQQENHQRAASLVTPGLEALDAFSYHGGFALALARAGARVTAVDESAAAIERLRQNAARNQVAIEATCDNAFDVLRRLESQGRRFDLVVVDPPALAKRRSALPAAERAYKELNLRALRLLGDGGLLVTCSCSGRLSADRFGALLEGAAGDAGRPVQLLERRGAGRDHPTLLGVPETEYLKCWILRVAR